MTRLYTLLAILLIPMLSKAQTLAVESCAHPTGGLFTLHSTSDGRNEYRAGRIYSPGYAVSPEIVRWNPTIEYEENGEQKTGRWEIIQTINAGYGATPVVQAWNSDPAAPNPPETGWQGNGYVCNETNVRVYAPETRTISGGNWSNPASWSTGSLPRRYDDVVVDGSPYSTVTLDVDATVNNFTFGSNYVILSGSNKLTVQGNAGGSGALYIQELIMAGTQPQTLGVFPQGYKLTIRNAAGVSLSAGIGPNGFSQEFFMTLSFESGHLYLGDFDLRVSDITGAGSSKHVVTNGTGSLFISAIVPQHPGIPPFGIPYEKEFPVSNSGIDYKPLLISLQPNSASIPGPDGHIPYYSRLILSVKVSPLIHTPPHPGYVNAQWEINKIAAPPPYSNNFPYREGLFTVRFNWNASDESEHFDRNANVVAKRYNSASSIWENRGMSGLPEETGSYSFTVPNQNEFSSWGIFNVQSPLPVTLASFKAEKEGQAVVLNWQTASETDSDRFEAEHSTDAKTWSLIGTRPAAGQSTGLKNYRYVHAAPSNGHNYYRLKMIDLDKTYEYSSVESIRFDYISMKSSVFPNPATDRLTVAIPDRENLKSLRLLNVAGQEIQNIPVSTSLRPIDISHLPAGIYLLRIAHQNSPAETHRVVIGR